MKIRLPDRCAIALIVLGLLLLPQALLRGEEPNCNNQCAQKQYFLVTGSHCYKYEEADCLYCASGLCTEIVGPPAQRVCEKDGREILLWGYDEKNCKAKCKLVAPANKSESDAPTGTGTEVKTDHKICVPDPLAG